MFQGKTPGLTESSLNPVYRDPLMSDPYDTPQDVLQDPEEVIESFLSYEGGEIDPLQIPEGMFRPGYVMQWKSRSVAGNTEMVKAHQTMLWRTGWRPVPGVRGKGYFYLPGEEIPETITHGAMILMERPAPHEAKARELAHRKATGQLQDKLREIGHSSTALGPNLKADVKSTFEKGLPVPD